MPPSVGTWSGHISYGEMTLFLSQGGKLSSAFNSLVGYIHVLNSSVSAGRVLELVKLPREVHHEQESNRMREKMDQGFSVVLEDVFFRYVEDKTVLQESDFIAKPNEIVATHSPSVLTMCQRVCRVMDTKLTTLDQNEATRMSMDF